MNTVFKNNQIIDYTRIDYKNTFKVTFKQFLINLLSLSIELTDLYVGMFKSQPMYTIE
jgi:hypothetical protein